VPVANAPFVSLKYDVTIRQQPQHARISAMKISGQLHTGAQIGEILML
jgi:hypothetical protein